MSWARRRFDAPPEDSQFYRSSFRQLSDIQQRQVGAILGAAVADAAVREFDKMPLATLQECLHSNVQQQDAWDSSADCLGDQELLFPSPAAQEVHDDVSQRVANEKEPLFYHSLSLLFLQELLSALCSGRTMPSVEEVGHRWVRLAEVHVESFQTVHGATDHVAASLVPLVCLYPWGSDTALDACCRPLGDFLVADNPSSAASTTVVGDGSCRFGAAESSATQQAKELRRISSRNAVLEGALTVQSVLLRCLQSNPNPLLNTALQLRRPLESHSVLPAEYQKFVPDVVREASAVPPLPPLQPFDGCDLKRVASVIGVACAARSFAVGMRTIARQHGLAQVARNRAGGGHHSVAPRVPIGASAVVAGAILGARHGVRDIPVKWITATHRHREIGTLAIALSQWSWNPLR